jgi:hypothetical protein
MCAQIVEEVAAESPGSGRRSVTTFLPAAFLAHPRGEYGTLTAPYVGGVLTTNAVTSQAAFGSEIDPPGYTQASIATIRLWGTNWVCRLSCTHVPDARCGLGVSDRIAKRRD